MQRIEDVARAIYEHPSFGKDIAGTKPEWVVNGNSMAQDRARSVAIDAIKAMREPTNEMLASAGCMDNYIDDTGTEDADHKRWFTAMIDAVFNTSGKCEHLNVAENIKDGTIVCDESGEEAPKPTAKP